jgi:hypothetical protein
MDGALNPESVAESHGSIRAHAVMAEDFTAMT